MTKIDYCNAIVEAIANESRIPEADLRQAVSDLSESGELDNTDNIHDLFGVVYDYVMRGDNLRRLVESIHDVVLDDDGPDVEDAVYSDHYESAFDTLCEILKVTPAELFETPTPNV
jgi:hypothetical protein